MTAPSYFMDSPAEGQRVELKTDKALTTWQLEWAGIQRGQTAVDIGCAAGTTSRIMKSLVGPGVVLGVDRSHARLREALREREKAKITYVSATAESLPLSSNSVDFSWARFLLEYLPNPKAVIAEMVRITRPGGVVCVSDLDGNGIWTEPLEPTLEAERAQAVAALRTTGFDPEVGRRLYPLATEAGLSDLRVDVRAYNVMAGVVDDEPRLDRWERKHAGIRTGLISVGWDPSRAESLIDRFRERLFRPASFSYSALITVTGVKPTA